MIIFQKGKKGVQYGGMDPSLCPIKTRSAHKKIEKGGAKYSQVSHVQVVSGAFRDVKALTHGLKMLYYHSTKGDLGGLPSHWPFYTF